MLVTVWNNSREFYFAVCSHFIVNSFVAASVAPFSCLCMTGGRKQWRNWQISTWWLIPSKFRTAMPQWRYLPSQDTLPEYAMLITSFLSESQGQRCHGVSLPQWPLHLRAVRVVPGTAMGRQEVEMLWNCLAGALAKLYECGKITKSKPHLFKTHPFSFCLRRIGCSLHWKPPNTVRWLLLVFATCQPGATTTPSKIVASTWLGKVGCFHHQDDGGSFHGSAFSYGLKGWGVSIFSRSPSDPPWFTSSFGSGASRPSRIINIRTPLRPCSKQRSKEHARLMAFWELCGC